MRGYDEDDLHPAMEDDYGDYDDDGYGQEQEEEEEEEYEEEEAPQPTKEELKYLELRQRLKERFRKKIKKDGGPTVNNSSDGKRKLPNDNFGSFFGPSQPAISQRVIQETKSLLETQHLTPKVSNSVHPNKKSSGSSTAGSKPGVHDKKARVLNEVKTKVQKLKDTRDYSFLMSDDAQLPAPAKAPPQQRNAAFKSSEARSAQVPIKSKQALGNNGRKVHGSHGERKYVSMNGHLPSTKAGSNKLPSASRPSSSQMYYRKQHSSKNGTGPGRPLAPKGLPLKTSASVEKKVATPVAKSSAPSVQKPITQKPSMQKPITQKPSTQQLSSKLQPSISKQQLEQRREIQGPTKAKVLPKQPAGLSRPQINQPTRRISSHPTSHENLPKKRPVRRYPDEEEDDEGLQAISMIRKMFGYNPNRFRDCDDDLSSMEANFDDIMREEQRSAKIAREEDEEQLRLIEAEEREERERRLAKLKKKRKLGQ